ncbi:SCP2 sterol-binding domain-containing protein [Catellatospora sp. KI3]|uniref:SCP2 sterol-binding domain-containing protein n=1 Tax=Catellatospora sp. KI3 TaxID=3041620 RepID=UPI0024825DB3|nr:SCP2 sterol-binding domain-containing protein [Catellatospora sp. KI3]MDI1461780.1 SCP2 sterol-binding domain-containing protein [Catellatospora sp. KI3]
MSEIDLSDYSNLDPQAFAQMVKSASDAQLNEVLSGELRGKILDEIFGRMPALFRPERAGNTNAVIHWIITGGAGGGSDTYELTIADGTCVLSPSPVKEPKLAITVGPADFLKVVSGNGNPVMMFMTGKLKAKGDLALAANIANLFNIPKA